jgi:hypothetical protein
VLRSAREDKWGGGGGDTMLINTVLIDTDQKGVRQRRVSDSRRAGGWLAARRLGIWVLTGFEWATTEVYLAGIRYDAYAAF